MPSKDSVPKKKPVYGDKRRKKPNAQTPEGTAPPSDGALNHFSPADPVFFTETSEVTSPASETPEPVAMETETPATEPGAGERWGGVNMGGGGGASTS